MATLFLVKFAVYTYVTKYNKLIKLCITNKLEFQLQFREMNLESIVMYNALRNFKNSLKMVTNI